jgi:DNA-binding transcriptional ArsR family regulator
MIDMAAELASGTRHLAEAFAALVDHGEAATTAADRAIKSHRNVEHIYRRAMSALIGVDDLGAVTIRRELYRRLVRTSNDIAAVADRVWYAVLKQT